MCVGEGCGWVVLPGHQTAVYETEWPQGVAQHRRAHTAIQSWGGRESATLPQTDRHGNRLQHPPTHTHHTHSTAVEHTVINYFPLKLLIFFIESIILRFLCISRCSNLIISNQFLISLSHTHTHTHWFKHQYSTHAQMHSTQLSVSYHTYSTACKKPSHTYMEVVRG